jgi:trimeric autotransporter adhesin
MSRLGLGLLLITTLLSLGCGYGSHYNGMTGGPSIMSLSPDMVNAGSTDFTLTVNGSGFGTDSVVFWNGTALPSAYGTGSQVTAQVSASDIVTSGMVPVYVKSGGKNSNMVNFTVQ